MRHDTCLIATIKSHTLTVALISHMHTFSMWISSNPQIRKSELWLWIYSEKWTTFGAKLWQIYHNNIKVNNEHAKLINAALWAQAAFFFFFCMITHKNTYLSLLYSLPTRAGMIKLVSKRRNVDKKCSSAVLSYIHAATLTNINTISPFEHWARVRQAAATISVHVASAGRRATHPNSRHYASIDVCWATYSVCRPQYDAPRHENGLLIMAWQASSPCQKRMDGCSL